MVFQMRPSWIFRRAREGPKTSVWRPSSQGDRCAGPWGLFEGGAWIGDSVPGLEFEGNPKCFQTIPFFALNTCWKVLGGLLASTEALSKILEGLLGVLVGLCLTLQDFT